jgi:hypothetical protein
MKNSLIVDKFGTKFWFQNDKFHRVDGPAIEYADGLKYWYQNGLLHRLDGPAIEYPDGYKEWWYKGEFISVTYQKEFEKYIKFIIFK